MTQAQVPVAQAEVQQAEATRCSGPTLSVAETTEQAAQAEVIVDQVSEGLEPWYMQYKWYLLGGLAVLAGGYWWYTKKYQPAAAMAKNGLPVPTSARRPSGLNRNRRHGR